MKIVGKRKKWTKRFACKECKTELEISESDLHVHNVAPNWGGGPYWDPEMHFDCTVCHSDNDVTDRIPSGIQYKMFERAREAS